MRTFEYVPECVSKNDSTWKGKVVLKKLSFDDKMEIASKVSELQGQSDLVVAKSLVAISRPLFVSIDLEKKDGSEKISSMEDLLYCEDLFEIFSEVALKTLKGFGVGNV